MLRRFAACLCLSVLACSDSSGPGESGPYRRFLVLGGSLAAGVEMNGLTAASQARAWPALLANDLGTTFRFAAVADPGCPPPSTAVPSGFVCAGLAANAERNVSRLASVAVPGARLAEVLAYDGTPVSAINEVLLGAHSQAEAMVLRNPTFLALQPGDEDVHAVIADADAGAMTSLATFQSQLGSLLAAIDALGALEGAVIVGVMNPLRLPALQPGAFFFLARDANGRFLNTSVNSNCSPVTALGQPNPLAANMVSIYARPVALPEIRCDAGAAGVLSAAEMVTIQERVAQLNAALAAAASARGWAFVDPQAVFLPLFQQRTASNHYDQARLCQDLPTATTAAAFQAAVLRSCPVTGQTAAPNYFGALFSRDGRTLSAEGQAVLAGAVAAAVRGTQ